MQVLEFVVRFIRLPFAIGFGVAAYFGLMNITAGWEHTLMFWLFWPFILATMILEMMQLSKSRPEKSKK